MFLTRRAAWRSSRSTHATRSWTLRLICRRLPCAHQVGFGGKSDGKAAFWWHEGFCGTPACMYMLALGAVHRVHDSELYMHCGSPTTCVPAAFCGMCVANLLLCLCLCASSGFSGADLANLLNESAILAGRKSLPAVRNLEIDEAVDRSVGSCGGGGDFGWTVGSRYLRGRQSSVLCRHCFVSSVKRPPRAVS